MSLCTSEYFANFQNNPLLKQSGQCKWHQKKATVIIWSQMNTVGSRVTPFRWCSVYAGENGTDTNGFWYNLDAIISAFTWEQNKNVWVYMGTDPIPHLFENGSRSKPCGKCVLSLSSTRHKIVVPIKLDLNLLQSNVLSEQSPFPQNSTHHSINCWPKHESDWQPFTQPPWRKATPGELHIPVGLQTRWICLLWMVHRHG